MPKKCNPLTEHKNKPKPTTINSKLKGPRFLVHDGIFDSLDKSHLIKTYEFIQKKIQEGFEFQYIAIINEGGILL